MNAEHTAIAALLGMTFEGMNSAVSNLGRMQEAPQTVGMKRKAPALAIPGTDSTQLSTEEAKKRRKKTKVHCIEPTFPVAPRVVQVCKMPKTHVDHSYRDVSSVPPEPSYVRPTDIEEMSFSQKLHDILSRPEYASMIAWQPHGRSFRILVPRQLEQHRVLHRYFGHNRYSTFLSQLKNYGFKPLTKGEDKNCFYHEFMLRGLPHLCKYMPAFKEGRKLIADPDNEPDLATISMLWPVPTHNPAPAPEAATPSAPDPLATFMASLATPRVESPPVNLDLAASSLAALLTGQPKQQETPPARPPAVTTESSIAAILSQANMRPERPSVVSEANVSDILARASFQAPTTTQSRPMLPPAAPPVQQNHNGLNLATLAALLGPTGMTELLKYA